MRVDRLEQANGMVFMLTAAWTFDWNVTLSDIAQLGINSQRKASALFIAAYSRLQENLGGRPVQQLGLYVALKGKKGRQ